MSTRSEVASSAVPTHRSFFSFRIIPTPSTQLLNHPLWLLHRSLPAGQPRFLGLFNTREERQVHRFSLPRRLSYDHDWFEHRQPLRAQHFPAIHPLLATSTWITNIRLMGCHLCPSQSIRAPVQINRRRTEAETQRERLSETKIDLSVQLSVQDVNRDRYNKQR